MKQLKLTILLTVLMSMVGAKALASDIAVENEDGVTIYYNYINDGKELEVTYYAFSSEPGKPIYHSGYADIETIVIPEEVNYMGRTRKVTSIGKNAFAFYNYGTHNKLTSITIPPSIKFISSSAFVDNYYLEKVIVKDIGAWCAIQNNSDIFYYGRHLYSDDNTEVKDLVIPNSVTSIGDYAFLYCSGLTSITIPNSVTSIGNYAFKDCSGLTSVTIGNSVTSIGNRAFNDCRRLTSVTIGNSVTSIGESAFQGCSSLTSVTIPNSVTSIGDYAFRYCSGLTSVTIPNSVTSIGNYAFASCFGLTSVTIPNSVTSIGEKAFYSCSGLTSIIIPDKVTSIGKEAFNFSNSEGKLVEITSLIKDPMDIAENVFSLDLYNNASLYVPIGTMDKYKVKTGWKNFVWIEESTTDINDIKQETPTVNHYYDLNGQETLQPHKGLNIVKMSNGKTKKVMVR